MKNLLIKLWHWLKTPVRNFKANCKRHALNEFLDRSDHPSGCISNLIEYIKSLDLELPHHYNKKCIGDLEKARDWMRLRDEDRVNRNVKGTGKV